ncbi:endonuclease/exonuclease/phosphatase family protein [Phytoactinopolyspora halotolerans]|uniref:Endonuclease/exonuclease/phosphatase family protein n=1 Tax=Phytoactinopolyspora halotolerans TaxID=1981512 RepID=A0A6L9SJE7_9ACTN|nr:endonuclease/exonuclease/phosphatase family protein [Phytoactinopolyspora halotolerans]NEE04421.1 endonuclease/exonuclease/phosphatase family protein [Phytoactinopolyspora halotolerans]
MTAHDEPSGTGSAPCLIGPAPRDALHVMSYNLRYPANDPGHLWKDRRPAMSELLRRERPTVAGTQEGVIDQLRDIAADLPGGYEWIGEGRRGGTRDEFTAVFYDARRLEPREHGHFWLSDTPEVVASRTWGNSIPRMATWVRFTDRGTGGEFVVVNTHLDHSSEKARVRGADLLGSTVRSFAPVPTIVTGDFNAPAERSDAYRRLLAAELRDVWLEARDRRTPAYATFTAYREPAVGGQRIDWILTTPGIASDAAAINPSAPGGCAPSDHLPVQALLRLPTAP